MIRVKICGITTAEGLASAATADWIGFNFFPASPRYITPRQAHALVDATRTPPLVGLFVDPTDDEIAATLAEIRLDILQLYTDPARRAAIRARFGLPVWHPIGVSQKSDLPDDGTGADGFLIESKPPPGATRPGGNATAIDWSLLAGWPAPRPWLLAGGLTPDNVAAAIHASGATAVDVSSGVERTRGVKDPDLVRAFIAAARAAPSALSG